MEVLALAAESVCDNAAHSAYRELLVTASTCAESIQDVAVPVIANSAEQICYQLLLIKLLTFQGTRRTLYSTNNSLIVEVTLWV